MLDQGAEMPIPAELAATLAATTRGSPAGASPSAGRSSGSPQHPLRRIVRLGAAATLLALAGSARAQSTGQHPGGRDSTGALASATLSAPAAYGTIRGIVVDSLNGGPLVGAQVSLENIALQAITDSTGRFRIDSVPAGEYRIGVFHPLLDSLGFGIASPPLAVTAGKTIAIGFATPSAATIVRLACGNAATDTAANAGPSVLIGRVLGAETDAPIAGVDVSLRLAHIRATLSTAMHQTEWLWDATSGPHGEFRFCHLPANLEGTVRAVRARVDSNTAVRQYSVNGRIVSFLVLHVPNADSELPGAPAATVSTHGAHPGRAVLTGQVVRTDGAGPFPGALVTIAGTGDTVVTDDSGKFVLRGLPSGTRTLKVRAVGWEPQTMPVELTRQTARHVTVSLITKTAVLQAVIVTATLNAGLHRIGFDERKRRGVGHFLSPDDIQKRVAMEFVDLMSQMPGVVRRAGPGGEDFLSATRGTGGCLSYVIDGMPYQEATPGDINIVVPVMQIGAIEVYQPSEQPAQWAYTTPPTPAPFGVNQNNKLNASGRPGSIDSLGQAGGTGCVKVIIWTKNRLGV
jgi:CarboxypepD_reg-like domain/Carboxypeptidase regulatory-like domain